MKEEILKRLETVLNALNNVSVYGKANLSNLSGSITLLEEAGELIYRSEVMESEKEKSEAG